MVIYEIVVILVKFNTFWYFKILEYLLKTGPLPKKKKKNLCLTKIEYCGVFNIFYLLIKKNPSYLKDVCKDPPLNLPPIRSCVQVDSIKLGLNLVWLNWSIF